MLERRLADNGVIFYQSPLLAAAGVPHAFSTRVGGVSSAPFDTLNLGNPPGEIRDDPIHIDANYILLQNAIGCGSHTRRWVHQIHGACTLDADESAFADGLQADAILCTNPSSLLCVRVADCVPVLLASEDGRAVCAVHAGWRGVIAGIVPAAAKRLAEKILSSPARLLAAVGPCIGVTAYEVGPEVSKAFIDAGLAAVAAGTHVNLRRAVAMQLEQIGLPPAHIDQTDRCTVRHADEFFSHRRDNGVTGRMAAVISTARHPS